MPFRFTSVLNKAVRTSKTPAEVGAGINPAIVNSFVIDPTELLYLDGLIITVEGLEVAPGADLNMRLLALNRPVAPGATDAATNAIVSALYLDDSNDLLRISESVNNSRFTTLPYFFDEPIIFTPTANLTFVLQMLLSVTITAFFSLHLMGRYKSNRQQDIFR